MPRISEFFGILIYMYWMDIKKHKAPHFHAIYSGKRAVFDLNGKCLDGDIGRRANYLVKEWVLERQVELKEAWKCALNGKDLPWIKPIN